MFSLRTVQIQISEGAEDKRKRAWVCSVPQRLLVELHPHQEAFSLEQTVIITEPHDCECPTLRCLYHTFLLKPQESMWKREWEDFKRLQASSVFSRPNISDNAQTQKLSKHKTCPWHKSDKISSWRKEREHKVLLLAKKLSESSSCQERKRPFSSKEWHYSINCAPVQASEVVGQHRLVGPHDCFVLVYLLLLLFLFVTLCFLREKGHKVGQIVGKEQEEVGGGEII